MRVLIITRRYFPNGDATSAVIHNLALELQTHGNTVQIVALTSNPEDASINEWEGVLVSHIHLPASMDKEQVLHEWAHAPIHTGRAIVQKVFSEIQKKLFVKNEKLGIEPIFVKAYEKRISSLLKAEQYDLCIATLLPVEAVVAARNICSDRIIFCVYQLDTYWNNNDLPEQYREERKAFEKRLINKSDFIMTTPLIEKADKEEFPDHQGAVISSEFPLVKQLPDVESTKGSSDKKKHCVFLGTLYPGIRPPELVIDLISKIDSDDIVFDFYGSGQQLIRSLPAYDEVKERIVLHGPVSSREAAKIRANADILLNIDNTTVMQVPSKIFEYISTGKPIVNMYFNENSPTLQYFRRYPYCMNINLHGDTLFEASKLSCFIKTKSDSDVDFKTIQETYKQNTPEYVAKQFREAYEKAFQRREIVKVEKE